MQEVDTNGKPAGDEVQLLSKANNDTTSIANPIAQQINHRTQVIDKLVKAIERNTGNDPTARWASDGKWYNEAFNGITIQVTNTHLQVGFVNPQTRGTILDPKLIPKTSFKSDIFTSV